MKRYAIVGASHRCYKMFVVGLEEYIGKTVEFVGIYDTNRTRCEVFKKTLGDSFNIYSDFDQMLDTERPDAVLVATADDSHADYVVRSLDKGYDVPLFTNIRQMTELTPEYEHETLMVE